jgi:transcriptional regulator with XRE-family HTH domain
MEILRLKNLLLEKGVTGKDLAEKVGVSAVTISTITSGNSFPKPELLKKIAEELDVDIRELFHPTKDEDNEPIYIEKDGRYINIGELRYRGSK